MHRGLSILQGMPRDFRCYSAWKRYWKNLGAVTWWENHDLYLDCTKCGQNRDTRGMYTRRMRSSVILLSAILGTKTTAAEWGTREAASSEKDL